MLHFNDLQAVTVLRDHWNLSIFAYQQYTYDSRSRLLEAQQTNVFVFTFLLYQDATIRLIPWRIPTWYGFVVSDSLP